MTKKLFLIAVGFVAALNLSACAAETGSAPAQSADRLSPLFDPETGAEVGVRDVDTGTYYLGSGQTVERESRNTQFVAIESLPANAREIADHPPDTEAAVSVADDEASGTSVRAQTIWANSSCWYLSEGKVGCTGCVGKVIWEYCWDYQRS